MECISIESLLDHFDFMLDEIKCHGPEVDQQETFELKIKVGKKVGYDIPAYMDFIERYGSEKVAYWMLTAPTKLDIYIRAR